MAEPNNKNGADADIDQHAAPSTTSDVEYPTTRMAYKRKRTPSIVSGVPPKSEGDINVQQTNNESEFAIKSMDMLPTDEWKRAQVELFEKTRAKINNIRAVCQPNEALELPAMDDSRAWLTYCSEYSPSLSVILKLGQHDVEVLLKIMCEWLESNEKQAAETGGTQTAPPPGPPPPPPMEETASALQVSNDVCDVSQLKLTSRWLGEWLYGILACLRLPLQPELHGILREIASICVRQRGRLTMPEDAKHAMTYNIFIQLIVNVFGQLDFGQFI